jgi:hypothetical protein
MFPHPKCYETSLCLYTLKQSRGLRLNHKEHKTRMNQARLNKPPVRVQEEYYFSSITRASKRKSKIYPTIPVHQLLKNLFVLPQLLNLGLSLYGIGLHAKTCLGQVNCLLVLSSILRTCALHQK